MINSDQFAKQIAEHGGATAKLSDGSPPRKGYMVSRRGSETVIPGEATGDHVTRFIHAHQEALSRTGHFLGGWVDKGKTYLDVTKGVRKKQKALREGTKNRQKAVYDVKAQKSVYL